MKIKVINPNTSAEVTREIEVSATNGARPSTEILAVRSQAGPESIESAYDEYASIPGVLAEVADAAPDIDAFVVACFGDPGLQAAREVTSRPVVGIAEASLYLAAMLAPRFSVLTAVDRDRVNIEDLIGSYGMARRITSIRSAPLGVLGFSRDPRGGTDALRREGVRAVEEDRAEAILLGCAGMASFAARLEDELGVPVIDGVAAAVKFAESIVDLGKRTSKINTYGPPETATVGGAGSTI